MQFVDILESEEEEFCNIIIERELSKAGEFFSNLAGLWRDSGLGSSTETPLPPRSHRTPPFSRSLHGWETATPRLWCGFILSRQSHCLLHPLSKLIQLLLSCRRQISKTKWNSLRFYSVIRIGGLLILFQVAVSWFRIIHICCAPTSVIGLELFPEVC